MVSRSSLVMPGRASLYIGLSRSGDSAKETRNARDTPRFGKALLAVLVVCVSDAMMMIGR